MMKRLLLLSASLWLAAFSLQAQALADAQRKAAAMIDHFSAKLKKINIPRIDFEYTIESRQDDLKETMTGTLYLKLKQKKMRVEMPDQLIVADGRHVWVIQKELKEITKDAYSPEINQMNPLNLLNEYREKFLYAFMGRQEGPDGKTWDLVELTPNDKSADFFKIKLFFSPKNGMLRFFQIFDKAGVIYTFEIQSLQNAHNATNQLFSVDLNKYSGYSVTDLTK